MTQGRRIGKLTIRAWVATGWITLFMALVAMIIGHSGNHNLDWKLNHISTFATTAPHGNWITAAMLLPCLTLACVSILATRHKIAGDGICANILPLVIGATITGLLMLARFQETPATSPAAIGQQSLHDAGLAIFFYDAIASTTLLGALIIWQSADWKDRILGSLVVGFGLAAGPLLAMPWPQWLGFREVLPGLTQRISLLSLWVSLALVLSYATERVGILRWDGFAIDVKPARNTPKRR